MSLSDSLVLAKYTTTSANPTFIVDTLVFIALYYHDYIITVPTVVFEVSHDSEAAAVRDDLNV